MADMPQEIDVNLNVTVSVNGTPVDGRVMTVAVCACCSYRASERGEWPVPLPLVASGDMTERQFPAQPGEGPVRMVDVTPGHQAVACAGCADQQCNGCYHCATHCSCPPGTGRPSWILPAEVTS